MLGPPRRTRSRKRTGVELAVGRLVHLDEIGLDHDVACGVEGAAQFERAGLVGRAGHDGASEAFDPYAVEIEEHDGAVGQAIGGQDRDGRLRICS